MIYEPKEEEAITLICDVIPGQKMTRDYEGIEPQVEITNILENNMQVSDLVFETLLEKYVEKWTKEVISYNAREPDNTLFITGHTRAGWQIARLYGTAEALA